MLVSSNDCSLDNFCLSCQFWYIRISAVLSLKKGSKKQCSSSLLSQNMYVQCTVSCTQGFLPVCLEFWLWESCSCDGFVIFFFVTFTQVHVWRELWQIIFQCKMYLCFYRLDPRGLKSNIHNIEQVVIKNLVLACPSSLLCHLVNDRYCLAHQYMSSNHFGQVTNIL